MALPGTAPALARYWYGANIADFLGASDSEVLGSLAAFSTLEVTPDQRDAWQEEIAILRGALKGFDGELFLEFTIPRMGLRADAVLLIAGLVVVLEFKHGAGKPEALEQVWDYALDLKNFHAASHDRTIVPVLVAAPPPPRDEWKRAPDGVVAPLSCRPDTLGPLLERLRLEHGEAEFNPAAWSAAGYLPSPTIVQAAIALYSNHRVGEIARSGAGAKNLGVTANRVRQLVEACRREHRKAICFVTGVPGAGKTLVGLGVAAPEHADKPLGVYLSGNGPLVKVLVEALARDDCRRYALAGQRRRIGEAREAAKQFIQAVHHYRDEYFRDRLAAPAEHCAIFDEAQRAWDQPHLAAWLARKKKIYEFEKSESEMLIDYLDRHQDWAVVVCLVGEEQEINRGEAGIEAWLEAAARHYAHWDVYVPRALPGARRVPRERLHVEPDLHLAVSMRAFRSEAVASFVQSVLACERGDAQLQLRALEGKYPIALTRDLGRARAWLRKRARGSERMGMLVSSKAERLRPHAIDVRVKTDPVHWFLDRASDLRSSNFLEAAATEFDVQGLEVDWACVTWDGDLRQHEGGWSHHDFRGNRWQKIGMKVRQQYQLNAYRVLLTRARQGMVLCVPRGDDRDPTRKPAYYDSTYEYFASLGVPVLN